MKKDVVLTSKRLMIAVNSSDQWESIPYRAITGSRGHFVTQDIHLTVVGRRKKHSTFEKQSDRDLALEVLNRFVL